MKSARLVTERISYHNKGGSDLKVIATNCDGSFTRVPSKAISKIECCVDSNLSIAARRHFGFTDIDPLYITKELKIKLSKSYLSSNDITDLKENINIHSLNIRLMSVNETEENCFLFVSECFNNGKNVYQTIDEMGSELVIHVKNKVHYDVE